MYSTKGDPEPTVMRPEYVDFEDVALEINAGILALHEAHNHDIVLEPGTSPLECHSLPAIPTPIPYPTL